MIPKHAILIGCALLLISCAHQLPQYDAWTRGIIQAGQLIKHGYPDQAAQLLDVALAEAEQGVIDRPRSRSKYQQRVIEAHLLMANAAAVSEDYGDAESHVVLALERVQDWFGSKSDYELPLRMQLGPLRVLQGRLDEGEQTLAEALELTAADRVPHDYRVAVAHSMMGDAYRKLEDYEHASRQYEASLAARAYVEGSERYDVAVVWRHYADTLSALGRVEDRDRAETKLATILEGSHYLDQALLPSRYGGSWVVRFDSSQMPLAVYVEQPSRDLVADPDSLIADTRRAVLSWQDIVGPGVPSFRFVQRERGAHIRIRFEDYSATPVLGRAHARRFWDLTRTEQRSANIRVWPLFGNGRERPQSEVFHVLQHETGHALGIWGHSPFPGDVMYPTYESDASLELSERDRRTLWALYQYEYGAF